MNSPAIEAAEIIEKLNARDNRLGITLTSLRKLLRVRPDSVPIVGTPELKERIIGRAIRDRISQP